MVSRDIREVIQKMLIKLANIQTSEMHWFFEETITNRKKKNDKTRLLFIDLIVFLAQCHNTL